MFSLATKLESWDCVLTEQKRPRQKPCKRRWQAVYLAIRPKQVRPVQDRARDLKTRCCVLVDAFGPQLVAYLQVVSRRGLPHGLRDSTYQGMQPANLSQEAGRTCRSTPQPSVHHFGEWEDVALNHLTANPCVPDLSHDANWTCAPPPPPHARAANEGRTR